MSTGYPAPPSGPIFSTTTTTEDGMTLLEAYALAALPAIIAESFARQRGARERQILDIAKAWMEPFRYKLFMETVTLSAADGERDVAWLETDIAELAFDQAAAMIKVGMERQS